MSTRSRRPASPNPASSRTAPRQERAIATRDGLLRATVVALLECGYRGTTTQEVCRRAEVSRGTLLHHFRTRSELVAAAAEHVFREQIDDFVRRIESLSELSDDGSDRARSVIRLLWEGFRDPVFYAFLEVTVAARTDPDLQKALRRVYRWYGEEISNRFAALFDADPNARVELPNGESVELSVLPNLVLSLLAWIALDHVQLERREVDRRIVAIESLVAAGIEWATANRPRRDRDGGETRDDDAARKDPAKASRQRSRERS